MEEKHDEAAADELILAYMRPPQQEAGLSPLKRADSMNSLSELSGKHYPGMGNGGPYQVALIRRFDFSSKLQRMSVIAKNMFDDTFRSYVKGSPERIRELCLAETLPENFDEIL